MNPLLLSPRDIEADLQDWRERYAKWHAQGDPAPPTEGNVLRQFVYYAICNFIDETLGEEGTSDAFIEALVTDNAVAFDDIVLNWIRRTYGQDDE